MKDLNNNWKSEISEYFKMSFYFRFEVEFINA